MRSPILVLLILSIVTFAQQTERPFETWPQGPGQTLVTQQPDAELTSILNQIDAARIKDTIAKLVSFGTRHTLSNQTDPHRGIGAARDWVAAELREYAKASSGRMTVEVPSYVQTPASRIPTDTVISNIVATLKGSEASKRTYVISGHYDSRISDVMNFVDDAPGADDDASGVAISMELARIFATHVPKATIMFAVVAGEEQGLYGSDFMARTLKASGDDVQGMLDNDIVGSPKGDVGTPPAPFDIRMFVQGLPTSETAAQISSRGTSGAENDSPARQLGRFIAEVAQSAVTQMNVRTIWRQERFLRGGDHLSFLKVGYPAVRFTEPEENYAHQHQDTRVENGVQFGDLPEFVDYDFIARVAKVNGAALWSLAQAPGTPKNVKLNTSVLTNNSTLTWTQDATADGGYEVVWRASDEAGWSHVVPVGRVGSATLRLSKDNVDFGVRAVGKNGFKSPAAYPFPN